MCVDLDPTDHGDDREITNSSGSIWRAVRNRLTLSSENVLAMTDDASTRFVEGDSAGGAGTVADTASLVDDWTSGPPQAAGFTTFTLAGATEHR
jgi:hypothetical protein